MIDFKLQTPFHGSGSVEYGRESGDGGEEGGVVSLTNSIEDEANLFVVVQVLHEKFLRVRFEVGEFAGGDGQHLLISQNKIKSNKN